MDSLFLSALILLGLFVLIVAIPCVGVSILGCKLANRLSFYPSKTPAIQIGILWKLILLQIISFSLLLILYHVLADYGKEGF